MTETRVERDPLGELAVPAWALFGIQTERARRNFPISGLRPMPVFVEAMVSVKRAAALTHQATGRLDGVLAGAIVRAADEVLEGQHREHFVVDPYQAGAGTSHNMNVNEVLANRANELLGGARGAYTPVHPNDHVNMAQSTNDTIPTAIRLGVLMMLPPLLEVMDQLAEACATRAHAFDHIVKSGRTHLQDATPIRLGQEFAAFGRTVARNRDRVQQASEWLRELNIGGSAVGTGLNVEPAYPQLMVQHLRASTGIDLQVAHDHVQLMQSMGDQAAFSSALRTYAVDLSKIASDLRLLASGPRTGIAEIVLPAVQPGSSIMPGKVNPVIPEAVAMVCAQVMGNDVTIAIGGQSGNFQLNVMLPVVAYNLLQSIEILSTASVCLADSAIAGFVVNHDNIARALDRNPILVTALNPVIGYELGAAVAKKAYAEGRPVKDVAREMTELTDEELDRLLDPAALTEGGIKH